MSIIPLNSVYSQTGVVTETFTVDAGNGHFFNIPYSISGATVFDIKADTSVPELKIKINATTDGKITLIVPGGKDSMQQNLTVLVDGKKTDFTQTFENNSRRITISFSSSNSSIEIIGQHTPQQGNPNTPQTTPTPNSSCTQDVINHARQELVTSEKQASDLKNKIYQEYQQAQSSGQFNGTWTDYANEKFSNSPEVIQIKATHDKFSSVLRSCYGQVPPQTNTQPNPSHSKDMPPQPSDVNPDPTNRDDNQDLGNTDQNTMNQDNANFDTGGNLAIDSQTTNTQKTLQPFDLASNIPQSIPGWVRGIAGWWAEGKISDSEFESAIKFLVQQGIIKL